MCTAAILADVTESLRSCDEAADFAADLFRCWRLSQHAALNHAHAIAVMSSNAVRIECQPSFLVLFRWDAKMILTRTSLPSHLNHEIFLEAKLMMMINYVHLVSIDCVRYMYNASFSNESRHPSLPPMSSEMAIQFRDESSPIFHSSIRLFFFSLLLFAPKENKLTYVLQHNILFITRDEILRVVFHNLLHSQSFSACAKWEFLLRQLFHFKIFH